MSSPRYAVIMGRFAPLTRQALSLIREAIARTGHVIVLVASADAARSSRMPWTPDERQDMICAALGTEASSVTFRFVSDHPYSPAGLKAEINAHVHGVLAMAGHEGAVVEALIDVPHDADLTAAIFKSDEGPLKDAAPDRVLQALRDFRRSEVFAGLAEEARYITAYKRSWEVTPYPVMFVTVDVVIVHDDPAGVPHVLLVRRGGVPGKGLYAVPGGFVEPEEWLLAAALRELREETGLNLSDEDAMARLKGSAVFDDPDRSARGRVITHAFHFVFPAGELPHVEGMDDAAAAHWVPLHELAGMRGRFFDDHGHILARFMTF